MSKYICMLNAGEFDVVTAVNLLGASVKESEAPIGMFGSGVKYALAQAIREGRKIWIASGTDVWKVCYRTEVFRGQAFKVVYLQGKSGAPKKTAITSEFGSKDWTDPWFIFREFWSNMLDEGGEGFLTDDTIAVPGQVRVYLEYKDEFKEIYDNITDYFVDFEGLRVGSGRCFRNGVFVGEMDGLKVDVSGNISITETRTMLTYSAESVLEYFIRNDAVSDDVLDAFWNSDYGLLGRLELRMTDAIAYDEVSIKHDASLRRVFGDYMIVPNVPSIIADVEQVHRLVPIVERGGWDLSNKAFTRYDRQTTSLLRRPPTFAEMELIEESVQCVSQVMPNAGALVKEFYILTDPNKNVGGEWNKKRSSLGISDQSIRNKRALNRVMLHELNHAVTGAGDYDRQFTENYQQIILDLLM